MNYLTEAQLAEMAETGFNTYMMTADNAATMRSIQEHSIDEFGIKPNKTAVFRAYTEAKSMYRTASNLTKKELAQ